MKLSVYAREGHCAHWPGIKHAGQQHDYIGRVCDEQRRHRALEAPTVLDLADPMAQRLLEHLRDGAVWPADKATADLAGVPYVALSRDPESGEWAPTKTAESKAPKGAGKG
ncbi:MAG: hypothetical protein LC119_05690 [Burkholderiales bacterium]|nr:hypothetical protein [Burkholderiales bacterium]